MKNILSILSLSLVILIGYSEESISQVTEVNEATQREMHPEDIDSDVRYIKRSIKRLRDSYRGCNFDDLLRLIHNNRELPISEWFDEAQKKQFQAQIEECKDTNHDDQIILQNFENNIDHLPPPCVRYASKLLTEDRISGFRVDSDAQTIVQRNNTIRNEIESFSTFLEDEMSKCQARNSSSESNNNSDTAEYPTNNDFLMNLLLLDLSF